MTNRTRTQRYADEAHSRVKAISHDEALAIEYKSRADGFSVMVMQAGLAQSLGFLLAKATNSPKKPKEIAYQCYLNDVAKVLRAGGSCNAEDGAALHQHVIKAPLPEYRRLTREALAAAGWLKRMGQALVVSKEST